MGNRKTIIGVLLVLTLTVAGLSCSRVDEPKEKAPAEKAAPAEVEAKEAAVKTGGGQVRHTEVYFGDTHLHTSYSPDAYLQGNRSADPDTAYRFAKGLPVVHPYHRAKIQIGTPLDFLVVAEHAEYMGVIPKLFEGDPMILNTENGKRFKSYIDDGQFVRVFSEFIASVNTNQPFPDLNSETIRRSMWTEIIDAAERHNDPGKFTSFIGWEWSSTPNGANLHRVVFQREGGDIAKKYLPFSAVDSDKPEELWSWLDETSKATDVNFVAIPHNQNISKGLMFPLADSDGKPISKAYAESRMRWETVVETTQIKGDSETHPILSPTDEFADFETYDHVIEAGGGAEEKSMFGEAFLGELSEKDREYIEKHSKRVAQVGDYTRTALMRGMAIEARIGINPYKFGLIGSTDSHSGMSSYEEDNFWGKMALDSIPEHTFDSTKIVVPPKSYGIDMGAAGLAAVWAEENTREALFDAFKRKETYATTGPLLRVRFFGGWEFVKEEAYSSKLAEIGYKKGVPMGSELSKAPKGKAPSFLISAIKDPKHANLDRIQVIKGWVDKDGMPHEKIYDIALSDGRKVGKDGKVKPVGNTVDLKTATWTDTIGDAQLASVWTDPDFDPAVSAFYYVRVLQIPTPRHSLYDAVALNRPHPEEYPATIQERAYTSPIWYTPGK